MAEPFVQIRRVDGRFEVKGLASCTLGHQIRNPQREELDGVFVEWEWDGSSLRAANDRYGFYPIYYFATKDEIAFSTSIVHLIELGAPVHLDDESLAVFLRLGFFIGESTPFKAIKTLPPNASLVWRDGELEVSGRITIARPQTMSRSAAMDAYISLMRRAVERRAPTQENLAVPLSGGRDSRHIVLELCRQGHRPAVCLTADFFPILKIKNEVEIAALVCRELGIPHVTLNQTESMLHTELRKNVRTNFSEFEHNWYLVVADYLTRMSSCTVFDGIGGDVLSAGLFLSKERVDWAQRGRLAELGADLFHGTSEGVIDGMLKPELSNRFSLEAARAGFAEEFRRHQEAPNPVGSFHFWNRTRRAIALCPYGLLKDIPEVFSPYLDHELFDLLASLPDSMYVDHTFHTDTINRAYPEYKHLPYAGYKPSSARHYQPNYRQFAFDVMNYLLRTGHYRLLRASYIFPRLFRCLVTPSYSSNAEWLGSIALFFAQFDGIVKGEG